MASFSQRLSLIAGLFVFISLVRSELVCEDKTKSCKKWSDKKLCDENHKYKKQRFYVSMSRLCKKSCFMCGDDDASLFDTDSRCFSYFKKGYCDMKPHQGFMLKRCKYSCRSTIRSGIMSPGRGNFQRNNPPAQQAQQQQQQQGYWNQQQADNRYPQQYNQQYAQQYGQQYAQHDGQQQGQQQAQNNGQQQYAQQYAQQNDAQPQQLQDPSHQQAAGQQPQAQTQGTQSLADLPVQVQALSRKHKLEKAGKHHHDDMDDDDDAINDTDDDMD